MTTDDQVRVDSRWATVDDERSAHFQWMQDRYHPAPLHDMLGLTMSVLGEGSVEVRYNEAETALNRRGIVAGGSLSTMVDSAGMQAVRTMLGRDDATVTIELKVNFLRPAQHQTLRAIGRTVHVGGRVGVSSVEVLDETDEVVAVGLVTASIRRARGATADPASTPADPTSTPEGPTSTQPGPNGQRS